MRDKNQLGEKKKSLSRGNQNDGGLVESEQLFRAIFENAADGILLADSRSKKFLLGNKQICKALGYGPDEIKGLGVRDIHPEKDLPYVLDQFEKLMRNEIVVAKDIPVKKKDESIYYSDISALPITLKDRTYLIGIFRDVTERKQIEEALEKSKEWFRALVETTSDWIWEVDKEGYYTYSSPKVKDLLGYGPEEIIGKKPFDLMSPDEADENAELFMDIVASGKPFNGFENINVHKDGRQIVLETSGVPIFDSGLNLVGYRGIDRDITDRKRMEEALRESESLYHAIVDAFDGLIYICSQDYRVEFMNQRFIDRTGYDGTGDLCYKALHNLDQICPWCVNERVWAGETVRWEIESPKDHRWFYVSNSPIYHPDGTMSKQALILDITERKLKEEELARLKAVLDNTSDLVGLSPPDGMCLYLNAAGRRMAGFGLDEDLNNYHMSDIHPAWAWRIVQEEGLPAAIAKGVWEGETAIVNRDGTEKPVSQVIIAQRSPDGSLEYLSTVMRDISERKRMEEELKQSEERFRSLIQNSLDIIVMADENGYITYETPSVEKTLGYPGGYLIGKNPLDFIHPEDLEKVKKDLIEVYERTSPGILTEFRFRGGDGTWIPLEAVGNNLIGYPGINSVVITARDISERKRAEAERKKLEDRLAQAQKVESIGTFAGGIAHDFNNILSAIIGYAELAIHELSDTAKVRNDLRGVLRAGNRAKELVAQIITFSRHGDTRCIPTMLDSTVEESFALLRSIIPTSIEIRKKTLSPGLVMADPVQIRQIIMNLCSNAVQAMGEDGGVLEVSLEKVSISDYDAVPDPDLAPGQYVRLSISDTGHGMPPEVKNRIFDPYFTTREQGKGAGLGLSVVQGIVRKHRGVITCRSTPGEGTTFQVYLPEIESEQPERCDEGEPPGEKPHLTGTGRILFIDDDPTLAYLADELLGGLGYKVVVKTSSIEALALFRENPGMFDLVITDMTMPGMTGDRLAQKLLEIRQGIPIILLTGYNEYISPEKSEKIGIRELIMKPFEIKELDEIIQKVLGSK